MKKTVRIAHTLSLCLLVIVVNATVATAQSLLGGLVLSSTGAGLELEGEITEKGGIVRYTLTYDVAECITEPSFTIIVGDFGGALDPAIEVLMPNLETAVDDDGGPGDDAHIAISAAFSGKYTLTIQGQSKTAGRFSLRIFNGLLDLPDRTTLIGFGERIDGRINMRSEIDIFAFYAYQGDNIEIILTDLGSAYDPFLVLIPPDPAPKDFRISDADSGPVDDAKIGPFSAPLEGWYQIMVSPQPGTTGVGPYALTLCARTSAPTVVKTIGLDDKKFDKIAECGEIHEYLFTFPADRSEPVTFILEDHDEDLTSKSKSLDPFLTVLEADSEIAFATDDNGGPDDAAVITIPAEGENVGKTFLVQVGGGPSKSTGVYALHCKAGEYEHPDLQLGVNRTYVYQKDSEKFRFMAAQGDRVVITASDFGSNLDPALRLFGPAGDLVRENTRGEGFPASEDDAQIVLLGQKDDDVLPQTGEYVLELYGETNEKTKRDTFGPALIWFLKF